MADANKPVRLNKIAREFNLGIQTIVDFLGSKGMEVDAKPTTKIDADAYGLIRANFQDEKAAKEKAVSSANRAVTERESVTLASARRSPEVKEAEEPEIDLSVFQKSQQQPVVDRIEPEVPKVADPAPKAEPKAVEAPEPAETPEPSAPVERYRKLSRKQKERPRQRQKARSKS